MNEIKVLRPSGSYYSSKPLTIFSIDGDVLFQLNQAPALLVNIIRKEMFRIDKQKPILIRDIMIKAADFFLKSELDGQYPADYVNMLHRLSGLPIKSINNSMEVLSEFLATVNLRVNQGMPKGTINIEDISPAYTGAVWVPCGELLSVIAPGNHPLANQGWLEALSYGYRILIRPSHKDPLTAYRLVLALKKAGLSEGMIAYVPCDHSHVNNIVTAGDLTLIYGSKSMVARYQHNHKVILRGPGYSKILLNSNAFCLSDLMQRHVAESILDDGGVKCTNVSGLLVEGLIDPVITLLKSQLSKAKAAPLYSQNAVLPVMTYHSATQYLSFLKKICAENSIEMISVSGKEFLVDFGDGTACIEPIILFSDKSPEVLDNLNLELPFPCVWITSWPKSKNILDLGETLCFGFYIDDLKRLSEALMNVNIKKIIMAGQQVSSNFDIPHDGFLSDKLLKVRGFRGNLIP